VTQGRVLLKQIATVTNERDIIAAERDAMMIELDAATMELDTTRSAAAVADAAIADLTAQVAGLLSEVARLQSGNEELTNKLEEADSRWRRQTKLNKMVGAAYTAAFEKAHAAVATAESVKPAGRITSFFAKVGLPLDDDLSPLCNTVYDALKTCVHHVTLLACGV
jgi:predicted  nucleic acid-binding Zn-ribbon protein